MGERDKEREKYIARIKEIIGDPEKFVDMVILGAEEKGLSGPEILEAFKYLETSMKEIKSLLDRRHKTWEEADEASEAYWKVMDNFADLLQYPHGTVH